MPPRRQRIDQRLLEQVIAGQAELEQAPLPIVLWSFGLLSLNQLEEVFDWQNSQL